MPALTFDPCTVTVEPSARRYRQNVLDSLLADVATLINLAADSPDKTLMKTFFGTKNFSQQGDYDKIVTDTETLRDWLIQNKTIAFISKNVLGSLAACDQSNDKPEFHLNSGFGQARWGWGERVGTLIHEFTHKALKTKDHDTGKTFMTVDGSAPEMAYGAKSFTLADDQNLHANALTNAENWGYYICGYRVKAGFSKTLSNDKSTDKWKYLSKQDLTMFQQRLNYLADVQGQKEDPFYVESNLVVKPQVASPKLQVGPSSAGFVCPYCKTTMDAEFILTSHKRTCPSKPKAM